MPSVTVSNKFCQHYYKPNQTKPNQTKPNQTKPNQTKPNQTNPFLYSAIDLITHGSPGTITLGSAVLNNDNLDDYAGQLAQIGQYLTDDGDILLYGCEVAKGQIGQTFIERLAHLTQIHVAASTTLTGASELNADWRLQAHFGSIQSEALQFAYDGVLAIIDGTTNNDTLSGTPDDDVFTGGAGNDTLIGGGGNDVARFLGNHDEYQLSTDETGRITVRDVNTANGDEGTDTLDGDMTLRFADGDYAADVVSTGGEFRVNTTSVGSGLAYPKIAALNDGGFVMSWESHDANWEGIYAQRYDASGVAVGEKFRVNATTDLSETNPTITALHDGGFVVSWESINLDSDAGGAGNGIYAQRYDASGVAVGGEIPVGTFSANIEEQPTITVLTGGGFVVSWMLSELSNGAAWAILARRYDADGEAVGGSFQANTTISDLLENPTIVALKDGGFVVSWTAFSYDDTAGWGIYAQRYNMNGEPVGGEFQIKATGAGFLPNSVTTSLGDGGFVVSWRALGQDGSGTAIYAQRYDASAEAVGGEFQVNTSAAASPGSPTITTLADGGFVISWTAYNPDFSDSNIYAQRYDASGGAVGGEFQINSNSTGFQQNPTITALADGGFVGSWITRDPDGSGHDFIYAQRFDADGNPVQSVVQLSPLNTAAPTATNLSAAQTYTEDTPLNLTDIVISDNDSANVTATLTLSNPAAGSLTIATSGAVTSSYDANTGLWIASGAIADVNTLLAGVTFNPAPNFNGNFTIGTSVSDGVTAPVTGSKAMTGTAVNDAPQLTGVPATLPEGTVGTGYTVTAASLLTGWTDGDSATLSVQNLTADHGTVVNNGDGTFTIQPQVNYNGPVTLNYQVSDGVENIAASLQFTLTADVNQPPVLNTALVNQAVKFGNALNYNAGTAFSDPDGDALNFSATLANGDPLPAWLQINAATGAVSGIPAIGNRGTYALTVKATDTHGSSVTAPMTVAVTSIDAGNLLVSTAGNDTLAGTAANDTASYAFATAPVTVSLAIATQQNTLGAGLDTLTAINNLIGSDFNDQLTGNGQNNALEGGAGNDTLNGAGGADTMIGGLGDDTFTVNHTGDIVTELLNEGIDKVNSNLTYTLPAHVEHLTLTGTVAINGTGNDLNNVIIGNSADNELNGQAGNDTLNGGGGNDTLIGWAGADNMLGGAGNDIYFVENVGDVVTELFNAGTDTVSSRLTYTLPNTVEHLVLTGNVAVNGTGNALANTMTGNSAANQLVGMAGNDTLNGGGGNDNLNGGAGIDSLDGGAGADSMSGGTGNDHYVVDNVGDIVTELLNEGQDTVSTQRTYTLSNNVEHLMLTGTAAVSGTGNGLANTLTGNTAANQLNGLAGNDTLIGGAGNDSLDGGTGADLLTGGTGNDMFKFTTAGGIDSITDFSVVNDTIQLENPVFTRLNTGTLAPGQFRIGTQAQDGNDYVIYNNVTGALLYDANGNGAGGAVQIATLSAGLGLTNADFVVI